MKALLGPLQNWWSKISLREQRLVMICSLFVVLGGVYWGLIQPVAERAEAAQMRIQSEKQLLSWVKDQADTISQLRTQSGQVVSGQPLNQAVSSSARRYKVELVRVQPRGEQLQVWIAPMPFNQFVEWITALQENHGILVSFLDIDKGDSEGVIEVKRLQFTKG
ncbi:general secretion pathway protein M [Vibrio sinaloensis DSM 21326]|uniref:Type II secretion system protein M n=1 Tax=Vibrio sinaloensis DSM 21326 TaxID=945550 RepID=E8M504_PHOS4|nr:type II secretion system protein M [Vibrio sinaloensis]EGA70855.1 general secretion pathway protein M [Vibrio sinaloensis DSM 21326]